MPKKKSKSPARRQNTEEIYPVKRNRTLKAVSIWIIISLILSFLVGALAFTPAPASADTIKFVQILNSENSNEIASFDTDGDGIENNLDDDIDGDGILNFDDPDIDGDGVQNFDDGDPAHTNGFDSENPARPGSIQVFGVRIDSGNGFAWVVLIAAIGVGFIAALKALDKRKKR